jgi:hypothetical protein
MRGDTLALGFVLGLFVPFIGFFAYCLFIVTILRPELELGFFLRGMIFGIKSNIAPALSLSLLADAGLFFWFDRRRWLKAMRGVISAMFVHGVLIIVFLVLWGKAFM